MAGIVEIEKQIVLIGYFLLLVDDVNLLSGGQTEREDKVSLETTEEILQSMEVGMTFRDYVSLGIWITLLFKNS